MKGFTAIGLIVALVIVAILALFFLRTTTVSTPETTETPIERAQVLQCQSRLKIISDEIRLFQVEHGHYPSSLSEIRDDYRCPVTGVEYEYDSSSGKVWCPDHSQR